MKYIQNRIIQLDILRFFAILLVLFRHADIPDKDGSVHNVILNYIKNIGWIGVDLFFVLSGFLICGLFIVQLNRDQTINLKRFYKRRFFKIYPSFLLLILITVVYNFLRDRQINTLQLLSELFFFQNYTEGLWNHTWTLAVEEHFYLIFPFIFLIFYKQHFSKISLILIILITLIIGYRFYNFEFNTVYDERDIFFKTHLRIDSLFFGALLKLMHSARHALICIIIKYRWVFLSSSLLILITLLSVYTTHSQVMVTIGFTIVYVCFGLILICFLSFDLNSTKNIFIKFLAYLGSASYAIYLFHLGVKFWLIPIFCYLFKINLLNYLNVYIYIILSLIIGILYQQLVEKWILSYRDKIIKA